MAANHEGIIYQGAYGHRSVETDAPMTEDSIFWIASMTKALTSVAAMRLVEKGQLQLDHPLGEIVPELDTIQVLEGFSSDGEPTLRRPRRPISLRHLLTHTAGFTYDFFNADTIRYISHQGLPGITTCKNAALHTPLAFDPGDRWEYGINIDWVGKAVEAVSGQTLREYLREHILDPLQMHDTDFIIATEARSRVAAMHQRDETGQLTRIDFEVPQNPEFFMGGGGLYSTGKDYLTFLQMLLHEGVYNQVQILQPETVRQMNRNHLGDLDVLPMKSTIPTLTNDTNFFPGMVKKWGLGYMITTENAPTGRAAGSLAWAGLGNTYYWNDPTTRVTGVILTQILPFADEAILKVFAAFEEQIYKSLSRE